MPFPLRKKNRQEPTNYSFWNLVLTFIVATCGLIKFVVIDWGLHELSVRQKQVEVTKAESELLTIEGQWNEIEGYVSDGKVSFQISPVFIDIKNNGDAEATIEKIEFSVYSAQFDHVISTIPPEGSRQSWYSFIDPDSRAWQIQTTINSHAGPLTIPAGQVRSERRHLCFASSDCDILTKVEVQVVTARKSYRWYGFSPDSLMCRTVPFSGTPDQTLNAVDSAPAPPALAK